MKSLLAVIYRHSKNDHYRFVRLYDLTNPLDPVDVTQQFIAADRPYIKTTRTIRVGARIHLPTALNKMIVELD